MRLAACLAVAVLAALAATPFASAACVIPDNGSGTVTLPPVGCDYLSPNDVHKIIDGLPPGTTIEVGAIHQDFFCPGQDPLCSFQNPPPSTCTHPGGPLGGEQECARSSLELHLKGTGVLGAYTRTLNLPVSFETNVAPRVPGAPIQSFNTEMFRLQGQITGDPDFDLLRITAGSDFGMPSPGHTTLTRLPSGSWAVDSFFDITYRIDFVGHPGSVLGGMSGSTTGTIRMATGGPVCNNPQDCNDGNPCTTDACDLQACVAPDNGTGTANLPPTTCGYVGPADVHRIINGLPAGTTLELGAQHAGFTGIVAVPGGSLGGEKENFNSGINLHLRGTGALSGYDRLITMQLGCEAHTAPRTPGMPVQSFNTKMFRMQGQLPAGDPDFDLLRITAGDAFGMPSPGHTTLTQQGASWAVDSFFDITYRIDFIGHPGGPFGGMSGSTTGTIRMTATGGGQCSHTLIDCNDNNPCTNDSCNPTTGTCQHTPVDCNDGNPCTNDSCNIGGPACDVTDNGTGTATLPPQGCRYVSPATVHQIINGLPPGTTIQVAAVHKNFLCPSGPSSVCSFAMPIPGVDCEQPGGTLGGDQECADSTLSLSLTGTGALSGYTRTLDLPIAFETHTASHTPGTPIQSFDTKMFRAFGQMTGDPDFDLLRVVGGTDFGLPSPGHTTLTQSGPGWSVDSFFDITYRIDFVGRAGGPLNGMSGSTTATIRMATGGTGCKHTPIDCNDNNPCTTDFCNPDTGQCEHGTTDCNDGNPCTIDGCTPNGGPDCSVPDNGTGTATLPPAGCGYVGPSQVHQIINGLPPGTTIQLAATHQGFFCPTTSPVCSFPLPTPGTDCDQAGGQLGGEEECARSALSMTLTGTGSLSGYNRFMVLPIDFETHVAPRSPGNPIQSFNTEMFRLLGQVTGDPDFDLLRITAGNDFGMASPGHTLLTQQGTNWKVDSFFDITYRIDFVGHNPGPLSGMSGSTTGTIRMATGGTGCTHTPMDCNDGNPCTNDFCNPLTGLCEHSAVDCNDGNVCTDDSCTIASGCVHNPNTAPCDDGNPCTSGDHCVIGGGCVGGPAAPITTASWDGRRNQAAKPCQGVAGVNPANCFEWRPTGPCQYDVASKQDIPAIQPLTRAAKDTAWLGAAPAGYFDSATPCRMNALACIDSDGDTRCEYNTTADGNPPTGTFDWWLVRENAGSWMEQGAQSMTQAPQTRDTRMITDGTPVCP